MSAIAGAWAQSNRYSPGGICRKLLALQASFGPHASDMAHSGRYAAGRRLYKSLPEDRFDRQPLKSPDGRYWLVADVRLDDRLELADALGLHPPELPTISDSQLLFLALLKWKEDAVQRATGDYAFALFDTVEEAFLLGRDTAGQKPLHYLSRPGLFAFASMPQALANALDQPLAPDSGRLARFVADLPNLGQASYFSETCRVEPGHIAQVRAGQVRTIRYWQPHGNRFSGRDVVDGMRHQLDSAVARRLRRAEGKVATHLSSGFDSNAVTSSAALQLPDQLLAYTAAPAHKLEERLIGGRFADEAPLAASTARLHANIEHRIIRPQFGTALDMLDWCHTLAGHPVGSLFNNVWWQAINDDAADRGATVLLTGEVGNFGLSYSRGLGPLRELFRSGRWWRWQSETRLLTRQCYSWRNVVAASVGGHVPMRWYRRLRPITGFWSPEFLAEEWRGRLEPERNEWDPRPALDPRQRSWELLQTADPGPYRKLALARWGVEERDPTSDRRLLEFCFSLPTEAFLCRGVDRVALRGALRGRVGEPVLRATERGLQAADWHHHVTPGTLRAYVASLPDDGIVDRAALFRVLDCWPRSGWDRPEIQYRYRVGFTRALCAAAFAAIFEVGSGRPQRT